MQYVEYHNYLQDKYDEMEKMSLLEKRLSYFFPNFDKVESEISQTIANFFTQENSARAFRNKLYRLGVLALPYLLPIVYEGEKKTLALWFVRNLKEDSLEALPYLLLNLNDPKIQKSILRILQYIREDVRNIIPHVENILYNNPNEIIQENAARALAALQRDNVEQVMAQFRHPNAKIRRGAIKVFNELMGDFDSFPVLEKKYAFQAASSLTIALADEDEETREKAEEVLKKIRSLVIDTFPHYTSFANRDLIKAFHNLEKKIDADISSLIEQFQNYPQLDLVKQIAEMGELAEKAAPKLIEALDNSNNTMKEEIINALVSIKAAEATPYLIESFRSKDPQLKIISGWALSQLAKIAEEAESVVVESLAKQDEVSMTNSLNFLAQIGCERREIVPVLLKALTNDVDHKYYATKILSNMPTPQAIPTLIKNLADPHEKVRIASIEALGNIYDSQNSSVEHLCQILANDNIEVAQHAAKALKKISQHDHRVRDLINKTIQSILAA